MLAVERMQHAAAQQGDPAVSHADPMEPAVPQKGGDQRGTALPLPLRAERSIHRFIRAAEEIEQNNLRAPLCRAEAVHHFVHGRLAGLVPVCQAADAVRQHKQKAPLLLQLGRRDGKTVLLAGARPALMHPADGKREGAGGAFPARPRAAKQQRGEHGGHRQKDECGGRPNPLTHFRSPS